MYYYFEACGMTLLAWVSAISLMVGGFFYVALHFGCYK